MVTLRRITGGIAFWRCAIHTREQIEWIPRTIIEVSRMLTRLRSQSHLHASRLKRFHRTKLVCSVLAVLGAVVLSGSSALAAQPKVGLGAAGSFAVLAGTTVTNTGNTVINGNFGVSPGSAITGFPPGIVNGSVYAGDANSLAAQTGLTTAYLDAASRIPAVTVAGNLGGLTVTRGVYKSASGLALTGVLTLDGQGNRNSVFIFQAGSTLITSSGSRVNLINGARACNVFWQVGSSATLGTTTLFNGSILALTSITVNNGVVIQGRVLARNGGVTLINDTITASRCAAGATATGSGSAVFTTTPASVSRNVLRFGTTRCVRRNFRAVVSGLRIRRVTFRLDGQVVAVRTRSPFAADISAGSGLHTIRARVRFTDSTPTANLRFRYRACTLGNGAVGFTG